MYSKDARMVQYAQVIQPDNHINKLKGKNQVPAKMKA